MHPTTVLSYLLVLTLSLFVLACGDDPASTQTDPNDTTATTDTTATNDTNQGTFENTISATVNGSVWLPPKEHIAAILNGGNVALGGSDYDAAFVDHGTINLTFVNPVIGVLPVGPSRGIVYSEQSTAAISTLTVWQPYSGTITIDEYSATGIKGRFEADFKRIRGQATPDTVVVRNGVFDVRFQ